MWKAWIIAFVLVAGAYSGPITGDKRDNTFYFSHTSDWKNKLIVNTVQNDHKTDSLIVDWPKGGITRGSNRPIPKSSSDTNRTSCPDALLEADFHATLFYGMAQTKKTAGVYEIKAQKQIPTALKSEILLSTDSGPYQLEVVSTLFEGEVVYSFIQNKKFEISMEMPGRMPEAFKVQGWTMHGNAFKTLQDVGILRERKADDQIGLRTELYQLVSMPAPTAVVKVAAPAFDLRRSLLLISDPKKVFVGTGFVTLHAPADVELK